MSEYQYYEFRALDRPLDRKAMDDLRKLSSRAEITPTSFTNTYHYGDFRGKPADLMDRYFDAFLYVANWGTRDLSFRLPEGALDLEAARAYEAEDVLEVREGKGFLVVDLHWNIEGGDGGWIEGEEFMPDLLPVRDLLLRGDLRPLYITWLSGLFENDEAEDRPEPPVPPGLKKLPPELEALAEFFRVDPLLLKAAAEASAGEAPAGPLRAELVRWISKLPADEKGDYLVRPVADGEDVALRAELLARHRKEHGPKTKAEAGPRRMVSELFAARDALEGKKRRAEEKARAAHLDAVARRGEAAWSEVTDRIMARNAEGYDLAVALLVDLRDLAARSGDLEGFRSRLDGLRKAHRGKSAFIGRLDDRLRG
ncbi:MAG: hypothetical protein BGO49_17090 [Planctomycetales bacterium 71-10]|nr:MAG: hypothetical protein BGO49_17090 [Planctomycetales bacterium 71-10]